MAADGQAQDGAMASWLLGAQASVSICTKSSSLNVPFCVASKLDDMSVAMMDNANVLHSDIFL